MDPNGWTRYEKLVLSKLDEVGREARELAQRVEKLERETSPERFAALIAQALEKKEARGWSLRMYLISGFAVSLAFATFLLTAYETFKR